MLVSCHSSFVGSNHPAGTEAGPTFGHLACTDERVFLGRGSVPAGLKRQCMHDVTRGKYEYYMTWL